MNITFENRTAGKVFITINGDGPVSLDPNEGDTFGASADPNDVYRITVTTGGNQLLFDETLTKSELEKRDNKIVIGDG